MTRWFIDGNNVFGSRPDGWWNDRGAAMGRFAQAVAEWCWTHDDDVVLVFDQPVPPAVLELGGGTLQVLPAPTRGRDAADDYIVALTQIEAVDASVQPAVEMRVVTSDRGLRSRLGHSVEVLGAGRFREMIGY